MSLSHSVCNFVTTTVVYKENKPYVFTAIEKEGEMYVKLRRWNKRCLLQDDTRII